MSDEQVSKFQWFKTVWGIIIFIAMIAVHVWVAPLPEALFGFPAILIGSEAMSLLKGTKK